MPKSLKFKFILPFYYLYASRLKRPAELLSLIWIYPVFLFVFLFGFYQVGLFPNSVSFIIGFFAWMSIYEIGYLENDALTIRKEKNPNIRISLDDILLVQKNFGSICIIRVFVFIFLILLTSVFGLFSQSQLFLFVLLALTARLFFFLHNQFRSRVNIITYFLLCLSKYGVFPMVFLGWNYGFEPYWIILLSFPLLRTIEHSVKTKYGLKKLQQTIGNLDTFRVKYYGVLLLIAIIFSFLYSGHPVILCSLSYFFLFRLGVIFLIATGKYSRETDS
jgi:hypothetical protein